MKHHDKGIAYLMRGCEFVDYPLISQINKLRESYKVVGIGVYSDDYFAKLFRRMPIKPYEERARLAGALRGVDFVFMATENNIDDDDFPHEDPLYTEDLLSVKPWDVIYAPGTYDLFHEGHLQHLLEVRGLCDTLVVGVNSDDLVFSNKGKHPSMCQAGRMNVVRNLKFVDYVYLVETNDKRKANQWVVEQTGRPISAIFMGSDLKGSMLEDNPDGIPVLFTERDPLIMARRSSSFYRSEIEKFQKAQKGQKEE